MLDVTAPPHLVQGCGGAVRSAADECRGLGVALAFVLGALEPHSEVCLEEGAPCSPASQRCCDPIPHVDHLPGLLFASTFPGYPIRSTIHSHVDHILVRDLPPASGIQYYGLTRMAKYEVAALRLEASTVRRLASLARRTGIPKTVLARRMLERAVDEMWALLGDQKEDGQ